MIDARSEDISVYESMLRYSGFIEGYINDITGVSYSRRVKEILATGSISGGIDVEKYWNSD